MIYFEWASGQSTRYWSPVQLEIFGHRTRSCPTYFRPVRNRSITNLHLHNFIPYQFSTSTTYTSHRSRCDRLLRISIKASWPCLRLQQRTGTYTSIACRRRDLRPSLICNLAVASAQVFEIEESKTMACCAGWQQRQ